MTHVRSVVCILALAAAFSPRAPAQTAKKAPPKSRLALFSPEQLYQQAVILHGENKLPEALVRMKLALKKVPKNTVFKAYVAELDKLVEQDNIDQYALAAPADAEQDLAKLADYLTAQAPNERYKARAIFRWVADRIAYNVAGFLSGNLGDNRAEAVLKSRVAVCQGYSALYEALARRAGLEAVIVTGYAKGVGFVTGGELNKGPGHAWIAVKIDGTWQLLDPTWASGTKDGTKFKKSYNDFYYCTPPDQFAFSHFPKDPKWQLLDDKALTGDDFAKWAKPDYQLFRVGVSAALVRKQLESSGSAKLVSVFEQPGTKLTILDIPLESKLKPATRYVFRLRARGYTDLTITNGQRPRIRFMPKKDCLETVVVTTEGDLTLWGKLPNQPNTLHGILRYNVE